MAKKAKFLKHSNGELNLCQQKKKKKKNQIDKVVKPSNTTELINVDQAVGIHLQEEMIMDILSKLPVWSLVRFKSVSRFWNTLFCDPYFKINHLTHAKNNSSSQKFLVSQWSTDKKDRFKVYCSSLSSVHLAEHVHKPDFPSSFPANTRLSCLLMYCCCDGLVLLAVADAFNEHLLLWNPSTRESVVLPHPESPLKDYICGMEYDTTNDDYMILMINFNAHSHGLDHYRYRNLHQVSLEFLSLKSGSWRKIGKYPTDINRVAGCFWDCCIDSLAFVHGAYHWLGWSRGYIVVTYSISNEVYGKIPLVEKMCNIFNVKSFIERGVSVLGGMLCFYSTYTHGGKGTFKLWVMKDYGVKESWTELFTICDTDLISAKPKYWFADGEVLLCCRYSGRVGRIFRTSKGPFGIWSQCHTSLNGIIYSESSISPKLLI